MRAVSSRLAITVFCALACSEPPVASTPSLDLTANTLHEPGGYTQILGWDASVFPALLSSGGSVAPAAGLSVGYAANQNTNTVNALIVAPAGIPVGTNALRTTWPIGIIGQGPVHFQFWSNPKTNEYSKIYLRWWQYLVPDASDSLWESGTPYTKWGWVGYAVAPSTNVNQGYFGVGQTGPGPHVGTDFRPEFHQQNIVTRDFYGSIGAVKVGRWELWEALLEINTGNSSDGTFQLWITPNGGSSSRVLNAADVLYRNSTNSHKFTRYSWNPTFGGTMTAATRKTFAYTTDLYISAVP